MAEMKKETLDKITADVAEAVRNGATTLLYGDEDEKFKLLDIIASLHNELYHEVTGEYYDYMFHWANHGYGGDPNDKMWR